MHIRAKTTVIKSFDFIINNSLLLIAGTLTALIWTNTNEASYRHFTHSLHFAVNDVGMVFFFGLAAKEVYEATLPGGALSSPRQAAVPILAAVGGMATVTGMGNPLCHRHRILLHGRTHDLRS